MGNMSIAYHELHAFVDDEERFSGNPAGVCILDQWLPDARLGDIAWANNLSETAFLVPVGDGREQWELRWFTPAVEVDLCGHATLAAAAALFNSGAAEASIRFNTRSGPLAVNREDDGRLAMEFPTVSYVPASPDDMIMRSLGLGSLPADVYEIERIHGARFQMVVLADEGQVVDVLPDWTALKQCQVNIVLTAPGRESDFVSRFFAPAVGVDEDPVTGSTHCVLGPYWSERLGRPRLRARQVSARGGALETDVLGNTLLLIGRVRPYLSGTLTI